MTVATARFYRMRGSLSSGEYPLFSQNQDLSSFLVSTADVKFAKGLQTRLTVPMFTGYEGVNIVELDGSYYWATEFRESTTVSGSVEFVLDYAAPTSFFRSGNTVKGNWHKLPTRTSYLRQQMMNDVMKIKDSELFDDLDCLGAKQFWVQISGYDANNNMLLYGFFVEYLYDNQSLGFFNYGDYCDPTDLTKRYPSMLDLFTSISDTLPGLDARRLIDVSISRRCPYYTIAEPITGGLLDYAYQIKTTEVMSSGEVPDIVNNLGSYVYRLNKSSTSEPVFNPKFAEQTVTLSLSDYEIDCGAVSIVDWNRNNIMQILPTDSEGLTIKAQMYTDMTGIYTILTSGDQQITLTEGKLPYFENMYDTYRAYQLDTDRMAMHNAIEYARYQAETDMITGALNTAVSSASTGVMAGAITGSGMAGAGVGIISQIAGMGISMYASDRARELSETKAKNDFELSKKRAIQQPQTAYNVAYGQVYCILNLVNPLRITVSLPNHLDSSYYSAWCGDMGYPAEGVKTVSVRNGYYQGKLINNGIGQTGMYWDECNKVFIQGFKFISP